MLINLLRLLGLSTYVAASPPPPPVDEMTKRGKAVGLQSLAGTKEASPSAAKTGVENPKALVSDDDDKMRKICYYGCVKNHGLAICVCPTDSSSEAPVRAPLLHASLSLSFSSSVRLRSLSFRA